jgi:hypothetical protein
LLPAGRGFALEPSRWTCFARIHGKKRIAIA